MKTNQIANLSLLGMVIVILLNPFSPIIFLKLSIIGFAFYLIEKQNPYVFVMGFYLFTHSLFELLLGKVLVFYNYIGVCHLHPFTNEINFHQISLVALSLIFLVGNSKYLKQILF